MLPLLPRKSRDRSSSKSLLPKLPSLLLSSGRPSLMFYNSSWRLPMSNTSCWGWKR